MNIQMRRMNDADNFMEGDEHCRLYFKTEKIKFGTSSLLPGKIGAVDSGHNNGEEVFFMAKGRALIFLPKKNKYHELQEGDAIIIPPREPHQFSNPYSKPAHICWSLAPPD